MKGEDNKKPKRRSVLKRKKPLMQKTPIKRSQKPMKRSNGDTPELRKNRKLVYERDNGECQGRIHPYCTYWGTDVHHLKPRGRGRNDSIDNLVLLCRSCHGICTENPSFAKQRGLLLSSWDPIPKRKDAE